MPKLITPRHREDVLSTGLDGIGAGAGAVAALSTAERDLAKSGREAGEDGRQEVRAGTRRRERGGRAVDGREVERRGAMGQL